MGFGDDLRAFVAKTGDGARDVLVASTVAVHESVKFGSPITGAPGQPVDTANLINSWQYEFDNPVAPEQGVVSTNVEYAEAVEDAVGPHGPREYGKSGVGGSHSVKMTVAAFDKIVDDVTRRVAGPGL